MITAMDQSRDDFRMRDLMRAAQILETVGRNAQIMESRSRGQEERESVQIRVQRKVRAFRQV